MAVEWHPIQNAKPCEWVLRNSPFEEPYGIIRELRFGFGRDVEVWFRLVTWSSDPSRRELLGYSRDPRLLAQHAWDTMIERGAKGREAYGKVASGYASARRPTVGSNA